MNEAATEQIGPLSKDEKILGSFECRIDAMRGYLVCTNKGIKFIQGGGKYDKVFEKLFEALYEKMDIGIESNNYLVLTIQGQSYRKRLEPVGGPIGVLRKIIEPYVEIHGMPSPHISDMRINP